MTVSYYTKENLIAVRIGFEPMRRITDGTLAVYCIKPLCRLTIAEGVRFELTVRYQRTTVFKTAGLIHSPILPKIIREITIE